LTFDAVLLHLLCLRAAEVPWPWLHGTMRGWAERGKPSGRGHWVSVSYIPAD
jgi:hypothetical protein